MKQTTRERLLGDLAIARIQWRRNFNLGVVGDGSRLACRIDHLVKVLADKPKETHA